MSSKNNILTKIRQNTGTRYEMPKIDLDKITYDDKIKHFSEVLASAGGKAIELNKDEDVNDVIRREFPDAKRIGSNLKEISCATFNPDLLDNPKDLNGTDVAVVEGKFGVAENGAVWIPKQVRHKGLYFISNALVILLDKMEIVNNMHEAYDRNANPSSEKSSEASLQANSEKSSEASLEASSEKSSKKTSEVDYDYGVFMSGPSKTADIEQALVFGAHGPIQVLVILK